MKTLLLLLLLPQIAFAAEVFPHGMNDIQYDGTHRVFNVISKKKWSQMMLTMHAPQGPVSVFQITEMPRDDETRYVYAMRGKKRIPSRVEDKDDMLYVQNDGKPFIVYILYRGEQHMFPFIKRR